MTSGAAASTAGHHILPLADLVSVGAGSRADGLAELLQLGLPVPPGFVVLGGQVDADVEHLEDRYVELGAGRVVVRPSVPGTRSVPDELGAPGGVLGSEAVRAAIRGCIDATSQRLRLPPTQVCVLVQRLVDASVHGALRTWPTDEGGERLLEVSAGPGALDGPDADEYLLDRKGTVVSADTAGDEPLLSDAELRELAWDAVAAEEHWGAPLELRFAIGTDGATWWTDVRPASGPPGEVPPLSVALGSDLTVAGDGGTPLSRSVVLPLVEEAAALRPRPPEVATLLDRYRDTRHVLDAERATARLAAQARRLRLPEQHRAVSQWRMLDANLDELAAAFRSHGVVVGAAEVLRAALTRLLQGCPPGLVGALLVDDEEVEAGIDRIVEQLLAHPARPGELALAPVDDALWWLGSREAGEAGRELQRFLQRHGHRSPDDLELRSAEWREDPRPVVAAVQAAYAERLARGAEQLRLPEVPDVPSPIARRLLPLARTAHHNAAVATSELARVLTAFARGYRHLGVLCETERLLLDPDLLWHLSHQELGSLCVGGHTALASLARDRRAGAEGLER